MSKPPHIPGFTGLHEIGRSSLVVGYRGESNATSGTVVEVLADDHEESRIEFYRTSALQSRMGHPGMPPILFSGMAEGLPYRVREFVEGRPVSGLFSDGPLPAQRLISTARALASTLSALHRRGMVHTEIHPMGLRIDSSGLVRFIDVGRGWPVLRPLPGCERRAALQYGAPEASEGALARTESDIYSLGAVMAALAAGKPAPPNGVTPEFLREGSRNLPPALRVLMRSMLDKDPAKRPEAHTIAECLSQIDELSALLRLRSWKPAASANTFLGYHAYSLIGRDKELASLMALWQKTNRNVGLSVTILGPKGSGRRRLVEELRRGVEQSGGIVVRHRLDADPEKPTLIVNYSHKGRQAQSPDKPWLSVNFAQSGPVPDQHTIELKPLTEAECVRLAEAYLSSAADEKLRSELFSRGPMYPGQVLQQLDDWCEEGALRPARGRWTYLQDPSEEMPEPAKPEVLSVSVEKRLKLDFPEVRRYVTEMWPTNLEQDDPLVSYLESLSTALKCERADLYGIEENGRIRHGCASTIGRHRLDSDLLQQILKKKEPVFSGSCLLYPLECGISYAGFISLKWWEENIPPFNEELFRTLAVVTSPFALMLGQTQLQERRLIRLTASLKELQKATAEPLDILTRLSQSLGKSLEFETLTAWLVREGRLEKLFINPPGVDGEVEMPEEPFPEPYKPTKHLNGQDLILAFPLSHGSELLGGITVTRDPLTPFSEPEADWAATLTKVAEVALVNARMFGEQTKLLEELKQA